MSKYLCLSHIISQSTPSYGNRDGIYIRSNTSITQGQTANTSTWFFSNNHIGTHIDAPYHFGESAGKLNEFPISTFFFQHIQLIDVPCTSARLIDINDLLSSAVIDKSVELLLIRTGFEQFRNEERYWNDYPGISPELADIFRQNYPELRCIGFDFISLTSAKYKAEGRVAHQKFLVPGNDEKPILVIEDMALAAINDHIVSLVVAPLLVEDGNGGPVTVFANLKN